MFICNVVVNFLYFFSKRTKIEISTKTTQRWSLSNKQNEFQALAEMGVGMLDSDELSDCKSDEETYPSSSSKVEFELNDTNPELINLPGECISSSSTSNDSVEVRNSLNLSYLN